MATPKKSAKPTKADKLAAKADKPAHVPPAVNLSHAASSAATLLANRARRLAAGDTGSSVAMNAAVFNQMKNNLNQPQHSATSPLAGMNNANKPGAPSGFAKQTGAAQAGGANVARTGVPRRTSGG